MLSSPRPSALMHKLYPLFRPVFFAADPEAAHDIVLRGLDGAAALGLAQLAAPHLPASPVRVMGIEFPNRVGLAAGLDKNAAHLRGLATLGFGFVEAGTVTPRPQPGNPKPRMFRLDEDEAVINRLGFNSGGVSAFAKRLAARRDRRHTTGCVGANVGKNRETMDGAADYVAGIE